jgi:hypothetical protein
VGLGGARRSRTADLLNAILKTSNSLSFLRFPELSEISLNWAFLRLLCFRGVPRASFLVFPRCFPKDFGVRRREANGRIANYQARC